MDTCQNLGINQVLWPIKKLKFPKTVSGKTKLSASSVFVPTLSQSVPPGEAIVKAYAINPMDTHGFSLQQLAQNYAQYTASDISAKITNVSSTAQSGFVFAAFSNTWDLAMQNALKADISLLSKYDNPLLLGPGMTGHIKFNANKLANSYLISE